ncbi:KxYKxGKxW signal peptide domain-containing protein, partial [Lactococcus lactis]|uniref:KxYKxGKxW signal peptide domain-containing protein n=1 Tax=Lactococcus lactis TaxID=1358 RepID=UPI00223B5A8B
MKKIRPKVTTVTSKSHFRTWKSGKSWLFATSALAIIIVSGTITDQNVKADTAIDSSQQISGITEVTSYSALASSTNSDVAASQNQVAYEQASDQSSNKSLANTVETDTEGITSNVSDSSNSINESQNTTSTVVIQTPTNNIVSLADSSSSNDNGSNSILSSSNAADSVDSAVGSQSSTSSSGVLSESSAIDSGIASVSQSSEMNLVGNSSASASSAVVASFTAILATNPSMVPMLLTQALAAAAPATTSGSAILNTTLGDLVNQAISTVGISGLANIFSTLGTFNIPGMTTAAAALNGVEQIVNIVGNIQEAAANPGAFLLNEIKSAGLDVSQIPLVGGQIAAAFNAIPSMSPAAMLTFLENPTIPGLSSIPGASLVLSPVLSAISTVTSGIVNQLNTTTSNALGGVNFDLDTLVSLQGNDLVNYLAGLVVNSAINRVGQIAWSQLSPTISNIPLVGTTVNNVLSPILNNLTGASLGEVANLTGVSSLLDQVNNSLGNLTSLGSTALATIENTLQNSLNSFGNLPAGASDILNQVLNQLQNAINNIVESATGIVNNLPGLGAIENGLSNTISQIQNNINNFVNNALNGITTIINSLTPSVGASTVNPNSSANSSQSSSSASSSLSAASSSTSSSNVSSNTSSNSSEANTSSSTSNASSSSSSSEGSSASSSNSSESSVASSSSVDSSQSSSAGVNS